MSGRIVRFHPSKFWAATKQLSDKEKESLLNVIIHLAEIGDDDGLSHFSFITLDGRQAA
jgi:hypothetical protein